MKIINNTKKRYSKISKKNNSKKLKGGGITNFIRSATVGKPIPYDIETIINTKTPIVRKSKFLSIHTIEFKQEEQYILLDFRVLNSVAKSQVEDKIIKGLKALKHFFEFKNENEIKQMFKRTNNVFNSENKIKIYYGVISQIDIRVNDNSIVNDILVKDLGGDTLLALIKTYLDDLVKKGKIYDEAGKKQYTLPESNTPVPENAEPSAV